MSQSYVKHREDNALEECSGFIHGFLQSLVIVHIQFLVFSNVISDRIEQDDT